MGSGMQLLPELVKHVADARKLLHLVANFFLDCWVVEVAVLAVAVCECV